MQATNFEDKARNPEKRGTVIWLVAVAVALGVLLSVYFMTHTAMERPQALANDPQAKTVTIPI